MNDEFVIDEFVIDSIVNDFLHKNIVSISFVRKNAVDYHCFLGGFGVKIAFNMFFLLDFEIPLETTKFV